MTSRFHIIGPIARHEYFQAAKGQCNKKTTEANKISLNDKDLQVYDTHRWLHTGDKVCYLQLPYYITHVYSVLIKISYMILS